MVDSDTGFNFIKNFLLLMYLRIINNASSKVNLGYYMFNNLLEFSARLSVAFIFFY